MISLDELTKIQWHNNNQCGKFLFMQKQEKLYLYA